MKPNLPSFKSLGLDPGLPPLYLSPGLRTFRRAGPKSLTDLRRTLFFSIFCLSKTSSKICFEQITDKCEKPRFWLPKTLLKPFQNVSEIDVPTNLRFFIEFWLRKVSVARAPTSISYWFFQYFWLVGRFSLNPFGYGIWIQKTYQQPHKTRPEPMNNRCQKRVVFQHRLLDVSASILEPLGPPRWSQVGSKWVPEDSPLPGAFLS